MINKACFIPRSSAAYYVQKHLDLAVDALEIRKQWQRSKKGTSSITCGELSGLEFYIISWVLPTFALALGNRSPKVNNPSIGPAVTLLNAIANGKICPMRSTTKMSEVQVTPTMTTTSFKILLAVFSVVFSGRNLAIKSSYMVPAKQFRWADSVLQ